MYTATFLQEVYRKLLTIRLFEETAEKLYLNKQLPGFLHLYIGEEAVATGVCTNLAPTDYITSTHRGHGHCIAKGASVQSMMAELFGKSTGACKGKGGSMHIADFSIGMLGANGVVGGGYNIAVGAALASKMQKNGRVAVAFFGDGAANRGTFHEAVNMAAIWKLPVIFVCEMNEWASTTPYAATSSVTNIAERAAAYNIPGVTVNGNDFFAVHEAAAKAIQRARQGQGPTLLEAQTYRIKGHFVRDPELYRTEAEVNKRLQTDDPIKNFEEKVLREKWLSPDNFTALRKIVEQDLKEAVAAAQSAPFPLPEELFRDYYISDSEEDVTCVK